MVLRHHERKPLMNDDYETFNEDGRIVDSNFSKTVKAFMDGHNLWDRRLNEVEAILTSVVFGIIAEARLRRNLEIKREERNAKST